MSDTTEPVRDQPEREKTVEQQYEFALPPDAVLQPAVAAATADPRPPERVGRGLLLSLVVIPAGIVVWVLIWALGFISALVAYAVVIGVTFFYRLGSGGRISMKGLVVIVSVTIVTLVLAFLSGIASDIAGFLGISPAQALNSPEFWDTLAINLFDNPEMWAEYTPTILISLAFAALGTFSVFRSVSQEARAAAS